MWAGSIIHLLHSCPRGSGGGVAYNTGTALPLNASPSVPLLPRLALSSLTFPALGTNVGPVISQSLATILGSHVLEDFMLDRSTCSSGPPRHTDAGQQTAPQEAFSKQHLQANTPRQRGRKLFSMADRSSFNMVDSADRKQRKQKTVSGHWEDLQTNSSFVQV